MNRREFINVLGSIGISTCFLPQSFVWAKGYKESKKIFLLIELAGGNDGLNTVVPYKNSLYTQLRPKIAIAKDSVLELNSTLGLNPRMLNFHQLWRDKQLHVIQGVGYDRPNRSHFRSIKIWDTASHSLEHRTTGWIAAYKQAIANRIEGTNSISEGLSLLSNSTPFEGNDFHKIVYKNPKQKSSSFESKIMRLNPIINEKVQKINEDIDKIRKYVNNADKTDSQFENALNIIAEVIRADVSPPAIKIRLKGFDTHKNQLETHNELLNILDSSLGKFINKMKLYNMWQNITIMTYSEFGRRVKENGSLGTDHGAAAPQFILGGSVRGGITGNDPNLRHLHRDDLIHDIDYRQLYTTILNKWWGIKDLGYLREFQPIDLFHKV